MSPEAGNVALGARLERVAQRAARGLASEADAYRRFAQKRPLLFVLVAFALAKVLTLALTYYLLDRPKDFLLHLSTNWDGIHYLNVALYGYAEDNPSGQGIAFGFAPMFPFLIRAIGSPELGPFLVSNVASLGAVVGITRLLGVRAGLFFALFPTWLAISSWGYSESTFVLFAVFTMVALREGRAFLAGVAASAAVATRYAGAVAFLGLAHPVLKLRQRPFLLFVLPVAAAGIALLGYAKATTGSYTGYFDAQKKFWGSSFGMPWEQIDWLLHGWFTNQPAMKGSVHPSYWVLRNYAFVAISLAGLYHLVFRRREYSLALYSLLVVLLVVTFNGMPATAAPRYLLMGFPAIAVLGDYVTSPGAWLGYAGVGVLGACWLTSAHLTGYVT